MNILHIITQKPNSTGSGVYLTGMVNGFEKLGHKQAVIAGIDIDDETSCFSEEIDFNPVIFNKAPLEFPVVGMSDSMPYTSTRYRDLNESQVQEIKNEFQKRIEEAIKTLNPDIIICHHLYLLSAFVRDIVKDKPVVAICHETCLRQLKTIDLERDYIIEQIGNLDAIFALHEEQKKEIMKIFSVDDHEVKVVGSGYNENIFYNKKYKHSKDKIKISYAGKIHEYKGLKSLIHSLELLEYPSDFIELNFAGIGSDIKNYNEIVELAKVSKYKINFVGKLNQNDLAELFNKSQLFILPSFYEGLPLVILEALACNNSVITTNILGVDDFLGDKINNSGRIEYIELPSMIDQGVPNPKELPQFERNLANAINESIDNIIKNDYKDSVDMSDKTFDALCIRIDSIIEDKLYNK